MSTILKNMLLVLLVVAIAGMALVLNNGAEFIGTDDQAGAVVAELAPDYRAWAAPVWEPPNGEIESLLFALQAAIGAGFILYYIGTMRAKAKNRENI